MHSEDTERFSRRLNDSSNVAYPKLVLQTSLNASGCTTWQQIALQMPGMKTRDSSLNQENGADYATQGFSQKATAIILQSWRKGTTQQYSSYVKKWTSYGHQKQIDPVSATVPQALDFPAELFELGIGYSGINTARSALPSVLKPIEGILFQTQESVKRLLKGVYEARGMLRHGM